MTKTKSKKKPVAPLLSIAIPSYNRPEELAFALQTFADQIVGQYEDFVEIIVTDDKSTDSTPDIAKEFAKKYKFVKYFGNTKNIGLERNLINCTKRCKGEFLWIFGDDDYLEFDSSLTDILDLLSQGKFDFFILNRTRRSKDLSELLTDNWMRIDTSKNVEYAGLRNFCVEKGLISVIGFISVNIFRRASFTAISPDKYFGTMYPQLGMMLQAFHNSPTLLVGKPHICHRTATMAEKKAALGDKATEKAFMSNEQQRNATFFSLPFIALVDELMQHDALTADEITTIPENTVIAGLLIDFLINTTNLAKDLKIEFEDSQWGEAKAFFQKLTLTVEQKRKLKLLWQDYGQNGEPVASKLSFSVITPSYNQGEFLAECLTSAQTQTLKPIEHFVFDPGSKDNSREIARSFEGVTLIAEEDDGQSDAINKGFQKVKGDIIAWVNSDDYFFSDTIFERVAERFDQPDAPDIVYGKGIFEKEDGTFLRDVYINKNPDSLPWRFQQEDGILQPALFMRRHVVEKVGLLTPHRHFCMDYEYWIRCVKEGMKFAFIDENFARARYHISNKTYGERDKSYLDVCDMLMEQFGYVNHVWLRRYAEYLAEGLDGVLATASNQEVSNPQEIENQYQELMRHYNTGAETYALLEKKCAEKGFGDTFRELKNLGINQSTPCKTIPLDRDWEPGHTSYTVADRRWAFEAGWKQSQIEKSHAFLKNKIAERTSDTCVIVGNGPSLNKINLDLLEGHDVIISNNVFLSPELMKHASYYTVVNYLVAEQSAQHINRMEGVPKILPYWLSYCLNEGDETFFMDAVGHAAFSKDMFKNMSWRHTVTFFNLHLAYGLGYRRVLLTGFDHSYRQKAGVKEGELIHTNEKDDNHFNSKYFQGKKWQAADVDMMEEMYKLAKVAFEEDGREIINATAGGALELFPRQNLEEALKAAKKINPNGNKKLSFKTFTREENVGIDETDVVFELLKSNPNKGTMIDVGAHHGSALAPFQPLGWDIYAYEPDPKNRVHLVRRFGDKSNVEIDIRAVGEKPETGKVFYSSEESAGISGMLAFRDSHQQSATVDVTTIAGIVKDKSIDKVEFLKIDVEGYDFSVLKGVPWDTLRPDVIESEFEDAKTLHLGHTWRDICEYLESKDYAVYVSEWHPIIRYGIQHQWRCMKKFPCELSDENAWGNLLAFKNDPGIDAVNQAIEKVTKFRDPLPKASIYKLPTAKTAVAAAPNLSAPVTAAAPAQDLKPAVVKTASPQGVANSIPKAAPARAATGPFYANIANNLRSRSPALFRVGQIGLWGLRFIKRHLLLAILAIAILAFLTLGPIFIEGLKPFALISWSFAALLSLAAAAVLGAAFANMMANRIAQREQLARHDLRRELLNALENRESGDELKAELAGQLIRAKAEMQSDITLIKARAIKDTQAQQALSQQLSEQSVAQKNIELKLSETSRQLSEQTLEQRNTAAKLSAVSENEAKIGALSNALRNEISLRKAMPTNIEFRSLTEQVDAEKKARLESEEIIRKLQAAAAKLDELEQNLARERENRAIIESRLPEDIDLVSMKEEIEGYAEEIKNLVVVGELANSNKKRLDEEAARNSISFMNAQEQMEARLVAKIATTESELLNTRKMAEELSGLKDEDKKARDQLLVNLNASNEKLSQLEGAISSASAQISEVAQDSKEEGILFQNFNRDLSNSHIATFENVWKKPLNLDENRTSLAYMAHRIRKIENQSRGRLATTIEDAMLRSLVSTSVTGNSLHVLEIGTLFGIGAAIIYDRARTMYDDVHITLIDPLEGYYGNDKPDIITKEKVTKFALMQNLSVASIPESDFTLIEGFSTDEKIIAAASKTEFDVLIIDGDHSYAGVKADFVNFAPFVKSGGFIIVDDYGTDHWPEIAKYVDDELIPRDDISLLGSSWRTAVFKVIKKVET